MQTCTARTLWNGCLGDDALRKTYWLNVIPTYRGKSVLDIERIPPEMYRLRLFDLKDGQLEEFVQVGPRAKIIYKKLEELQ